MLSQANNTSSGRSRDGCQPAEEKKMSAAEGTAVGRNQPAQGPFDGVSDPDATEIDGLAMRAVGREHIIRYHFWAYGFWGAPGTSL